MLSKYQALNCARGVTYQRLLLSNKTKYVPCPESAAAFEKMDNFWFDSFAKLNFPVSGVSRLSVIIHGGGTTDPV